MRVQILGCSGGIGGSALRTTSLLVDEDILIDAGTGAADLSTEQLTRIDHVFLTHSHLDHVTCLPFILDSVGEKRSKPLVMYATEATTEIIRTHIFNWKIWPDFSQIPTPENPFLKFEVIAVGKPVDLGNGRIVTALPANHTVPAVGYHLDSGEGSLVFSGDTTICPPLWERIDAIGNLRTVIIEAAFPDRERKLAMLSKHMCPSLLAEELQWLTREADIFITHAKPGQFEEISREIGEIKGRHRPRMLVGSEVFDF